jgi:hypothetical protein
MTPSWAGSWAVYEADYSAGIADTSLEFWKGILMRLGDFFGRTAIGTDAMDRFDRKRSFGRSTQARSSPEVVEAVELF